MPSSLLFRLRYLAINWRKLCKTPSSRKSKSTPTNPPQNLKNVDIDIQVSVAESIYATSHRMPNSPAAQGPQRIVPSTSALTTSTLVDAVLTSIDVSPSSVIHAHTTQSQERAHSASCLYDHLSTFKSSLEHDIHIMQGIPTISSPEIGDASFVASPKDISPSQEELLSLVDQVEDLRKKVAIFALSHAGPDSSHEEASEESHPDASVTAVKYWATSILVTPKKAASLPSSTGTQSALQSPFSLLVMNQDRDKQPSSSSPELPQLASDISMAAFADVSFSDSLNGFGHNVASPQVA
ncbi:hypothetical protein BDV98DRAFT_592986 [Pterulicium gracile]|uniref:Uncharacterized protein n=1 Tax=Pterulicium gracile TaxID=1884261 RepID=A0A5C3QJP0_9AGAR|nr:hypothetical protein BDV98DRAFT_592986 [Pterula gracilis]